MPETKATAGSAEIAWAPVLASFADALGAIRNSGFAGDCLAEYAPRFVNASPEIQRTVIQMARDRASASQ